MPLHTLIDLSGRKFGRLTVLQKSGTTFGAALWLCQCDCGMPTLVRSYDLRRGHIRSCGCLRVATMQQMRARQLQARQGEAA